MTEPWLSVIGLGEDGPDGLSGAARALVDAAEILVGGERHLAMIPEDGRERLSWPSPLRLLIDHIRGLRGRRVCVLATGDPMSYGIGNTLAGTFPIEELRIIPAPSAFALACARLGWPHHTVDQLTLHGRPMAVLESFLQPDVRLLLLSQDAATPAAVAGRLTAAGYGGSRIRVLERMGAPAERCLDGTAAAWRHPPGADLNTVAVELAADAAAVLRPRVPGLPDDAFSNDGQLTKREVRALTLSALAPTPHALIWDVGAGCGSVAIEWMRADRRCRAVAIEQNARRRDMIADNALALGVPGLEVVAGAAPGALAGLPAPDAVFVGGGVAGEGMIETCHAALRPGGRLVANAVTLEGEAALIRHHARLGGALTRIAISRSTMIGSFQGWESLAPVTQWRYVKPRDAER